jgi:hypothetical protein
MSPTELANVLEGAFRTLDEEEAAIRAAFAKARDRIHERLVDLINRRAQPAPAGDGAQHRDGAHRA